MFSLKISFQPCERLQTGMFEFADPALGDFVDGYGIDEVKAFSAIALPGDEVAFLQDSEVFRDRLAGHVETFAKFSESLAVFESQAVKKLASA